MMNYSLKDNPNALIKEEFQQKPPQLHCWSFFIIYLVLSHMAYVYAIFFRNLFIKITK